MFIYDTVLRRVEQAQMPWALGSSSHARAWPPLFLRATNTVDGETATEYGLNCGPDADQFNRDACELVRTVSSEREYWASARCCLLLSL